MKQSRLKQIKNKFYKKIMLCILILLCLSSTLSAQSRNDLENSLLKSFISLNSYKKQKNEGLIETKNDSIRDLLLVYLTNYSVSKSLTYQLKKEQVQILKSEDKKFTVISWSSAANGVKQYYSTIAQYQGNSKFVVKLLFDAIHDDTDNPGPVYIHLHHVKNNNLYLGIYKSSYSTESVGQGARLFKCNRVNIDDEIKLFKLAGSFTNAIEINYSYFKYLDLGSPDIHYNTISNSLSVPIVNEDDVLKSGYRKYVFNGSHFVILKPRASTSVVKH